VGPSRKEEAKGRAAKGSRKTDWNRDGESFAEKEGKKAGTAGRQKVGGGESRGESMQAFARWLVAR
jgi:hypothetical protein